MNSRMKHLLWNLLSILNCLLIITLCFSQNLLAQRTSQNTYYHVFLHPKFTDGGYHKIGIYASMEELVVNTDSEAGYISPNFNHTGSFLFNNIGDNEFQGKVIEGMKDELTKLGYEVVLLNPLVHGESVTLESLLDIGSSQLCGAVCIMHYNVYRQWQITTDNPNNDLWMAMDEDPKFDKSRQKNYAGYLIIPNLYIYDVATKEFVYRGLNYGNNGNDNGGFYLSEQSDPFWKKKAAERMARTVFHYRESGISSKYPDWELQSIPKAGDKSDRTSLSERDEYDFWIRSWSINPFAGFFPTDYGKTLTKVWDPGTHVSKQLSFTISQTRFTPNVQVYGIYASIEFGFKSISRNLERFTLLIGPIFGGGFGDQTYIQEDYVYDFPVQIYNKSSTTGRLLLAVSFHAEYLISRSIAIGLRAMPGIDAHFYYPSKVVTVTKSGWEGREDLTDEQAGVPQSVGIPVQMHLTWYFK
ncbi:MAG: hypothetical protein V1779_10045 [bacterium]